MAPRETENNAYAKFWGDKQRALWYVIVFLEWSICRRSSKKKFLQEISCRNGKEIRSKSVRHLARAVRTEYCFAC